jgi:NADPH:quinone reductase-like Zn-dependent oxidoreductase
MATMRAIQQDAYGDPDVLRLAEIERPAPEPTEILVEVHAASVNPVDWVTRAGDYIEFPLPIVPGWDVSGVVAEIGVGVTRFAPGDPVFGMPRFPPLAGAYAEYVTGPSRQFARKPELIDHPHAAGLPLAGLTAWQILNDVADVQPGQRVLVNAAAGGVGHLATQIAVAKGAHVIGTARAEKHHFVRGLGAAEVIDYTTTDVADAVRDVDVVVDGIGGDASVALVRTLRRGGLIVPVNGGATPEIAAAAEAAGVRAVSLLVEPDGHGLEQLAALVDAKQLNVELDSVFPLAGAPAAHRRGETGHARGKIVLQVV